MLVEDDSGSVARVVVLYHTANPTTWDKIELPYDPESGYAEATMPSVNDPLYYFVQAVDPTGNVALALDNGRPFTHVTNLPHPRPERDCRRRRKRALCAAIRRALIVG